MYEDGNTVRRIYDNPYDYNVQPQRRLPLTEEEYRRLKKQDKNGNKRKRKASHRIASMDIVSFLCLSISIGVTLYMCISFLMVQSQITSMSKETAKLQSELIELQNKNNSALERIESSVELSKVYEIATKELGMVHANNNQVITYENAESDYVRKYADIPRLKEDHLFGQLINK